MTPRTRAFAVAAAAVVLPALGYLTWRDLPADVARGAAVLRGESLLGRVAPGSSLATARWASAQVLTQPVTLDTAPAPGFLQLHVPPRGAVLEVALGINPDRALGLRSGPFRFAIAVLGTRKIGDRSERKLVLEEIIDPARLVDDRQWLPVVVDLDRFAGQDVLLALSVSTPNLVDAPGDLAGWSEPRLVPRTAGTPAPRAS